jgi:SnoaL-like polyketide cyclase
MPLGAVLAAVEPVGDFLGGVFEGFPDFAAQVASLIRSESAVIAEGRSTGTHSATGPVFRQRVAQLMCRSVALFVFEEDRLVSERLYFDLLRQLGVLP